MSSSKILYFIFVFTFVFVGNASATIYSCIDPCNTPTTSFSGGRISSVDGGARIQTFSLESLNLKKYAAPATSLGNTVNNANARLSTSGSIQITLEDFQKISRPRNSWVLLQDESITFSMDIGSASTSTAQTWTLPTDFFDNYQFASLEDFVPIEEVPEDLRFANANKVSKQYYLDAGDNVIEVFTHFSLGNSQIDQLGYSYYYYLDGDDESFDSEDFKLSDVPISLSQTYTYTQELSDYRTGLFLTKYEVSKTVDAYGILETPAGDYECLRISFSVNKYSRPDESSSFTFEESINKINFVTKEGFLFSARVDDLSGTQSLSEIETKLVLPTAKFDDNAVLQLNNDGKGIAVNDDGSEAHPSSVFEVESDSLGILIPRIVEAKRPANATEGLLIYQTDNSPGFYYYDGAVWQRLDNSTPAASARIAAKSSNGGISKLNNAGISQLKSGNSFITFKEGKTLDPNKYIVNLQAEGENNGLYISKKTKNGFEVKELKNGKSNTKFSWTLNEF